MVIYGIWPSTVFDHLRLPTAFGHLWHLVTYGIEPESEEWCVGRPARRGAGGGRGGGWRLRVAAVANCGAADCFVSSALPHEAAPGSVADVLCPETLQSPHTPDGGGTATCCRRARPGEGLPPTVPTQTSGCLLAVIECVCTCITLRQPPQVPLQLDTMLTEYSLPPACVACRLRTQVMLVGLRDCGPGHVHVKWVRAGRVQAAALGCLRD